MKSIGIVSSVEDAKKVCEIAKELMSVSCITTWEFKIKEHMVFTTFVANKIDYWKFLKELRKIGYLGSYFSRYTEDYVNTYFESYAGA